MNDQPVNIVLLLLVLAMGAGFLALWYSPTALWQIGMKLRARSRALVASREAFRHELIQAYLDERQFIEWKEASDGMRKAFEK